MRAIMWGLCLALMTTLSAAEASGKVYRWVDARGQVHYSDRPSDDARGVEEVKVKFGLPTEAVEPAEDPDAVLAKAVAACSTKREQLATYENSVRLVEKDSLGREREFSPEERELLVARTRGEMDQLCVDIDLEPES